MSLHVTTTLTLYTENWETIECHWCCEELQWMVAIQSQDDPTNEDPDETVFGCSMEKLSFPTDAELVDFLILRCRPNAHQEQYIRMLLQQVSAQNTRIAEMFHKF